MAAWAAGPTGKASKADVQALIGQLVALGMDDSKARAKWIKDLIKRDIATPSELTAAELGLCVQAAKENA
jgi:hypothetical protein